jgi:2-hydroxyacyl-CoA lyase 1
MDAISLLSPHTKYARRPAFPDMIAKAIRDGYRAAMFGKPGPAFVDLPANLILGQHDVEMPTVPRINEAPKFVAPESKIQEIAQILKTAKAPLVVIGKGAAYARAERQIRQLIDQYEHSYRYVA